MIYAEDDIYDAERAAQVEAAEGVLVFDGSGGGRGDRGPAARVRGEHEESHDADQPGERNQREYIHARRILSVTIDKFYAPIPNFRK